MRSILRSSTVTGSIVAATMAITATMAGAANATTEASSTAQVQDIDEEFFAAWNMIRPQDSDVSANWVFGTDRRGKFVGFNRTEQRWILSGLSAKAVDALCSTSLIAPATCALLKLMNTRSYNYLKKKGKCNRWQELRVYPVQQNVRCMPRTHESGDAPTS